MMQAILTIYRYFARHRTLLYGGLLALVVLLALAASRIRFKEDIAAFLPNEEGSERITFAYQNIGTANKLVVTAAMADSLLPADADLICEAISFFVDYVETWHTASLLGGDSAIRKITYQVSQEQMMELSAYIVRNMPYFLTEEDYCRMDTLLTEAYIRQQLGESKRLLLSPIGMAVKQNIMLDPLHLSAPLLLRLRDFQASDAYTLRDDFIFSKDGKEGIVTIESRYPMSESGKNATLLALLTQAEAEAQAHVGGQVRLHHFGAADIAVTNAQRIKQDSYLSIAIAVLLILALLWYAFRSLRSILLLFASLLFGWLFAIGLLAVLKAEVSLIAVGISSIIIGIAVNYPLHFLLHHRHTRSVSATIKDVVPPLTIGNITTVGAFLALLFMSSDAMHDLGLFASLLLVGTIGFVLVVMPQMVSPKTLKTIETIETIKTLRKPLPAYLLPLILLLTILFVYLSRGTQFETDMHKINYMTEQQQADMRKMVDVVEQGMQTVYFVSEGATADEALAAYEASRPALDSLLACGAVAKVSGIGGFVPSHEMQRQRLERWRRFCAQALHATSLLGEIGVSLGFQPNAFRPFEDMLNRDYEVQDLPYFAPITSSLADSYIVNKDGRHLVVSLLKRYETGDMRYETQSDSASQVSHLTSQVSHLTSQVSNLTSQVSNQHFTFDAGSITRTMITALSNDFNTALYICGAIVFLFLLFTLGRIELTLLAFLPLTVGWFWILGLMNMFDIRFNIVNIILATLIFGQGDDYTIFMTEGLMYEYAYKRKLLASYKKSIVLSALIMFAGIGSLIFAQHPALHSLAQVTIIGMGVVVLMTFVLPPLIFRWLTTSDGHKRITPVTLRNLATSLYAFAVFLIGSVMLTVVGFVLFFLSKKTDRKELLYHRLLRTVASLVISHIPRVRTTYSNAGGETFGKPAIITCNHQSHLDLMCVLSLTPKLIILTNDWVWRSPFYGRLIRYASFYPVSNGIESALPQLQAMVNKGYSVVVFPEGTRSPDCRIQRFHQGAFLLAQQLNLDILPILIHGAGHVLPKTDFMLRKGAIHVEVLPRIDVRREICDMSYETEAGSHISNPISHISRGMRRYYQAAYTSLAERIETPDYYADMVQHCYIYKGVSVERSVNAKLKRHHSYTATIAQLKDCQRILIQGCGYGELPLLLSLVCKNMQIVATDGDADKLALAAGCALVGKNLHYTDTVEGEFDMVIDMANIDNGGLSTLISHHYQR
jgi:1-acyl-sn-glycerol-3-phosphate acyltransferase